MNLLTLRGKTNNSKCLGNDCNKRSQRATTQKAVRQLDNHGNRNGKKKTKVKLSVGENHS